MVAIFTGQGNGLERGSGSVLGGAGLLGSMAQGRGGDQLFLNAATGNFLINQRDEMLVGRGPDAIVSRTYNSQGDTTDPDGDNWHASTNRQITGYTGTGTHNSGTVNRVGADGAVITYTWNGTYTDEYGTGAYVATDGGGAYDVLRWDGVSGWTWVDGDTRAVEKYEQFTGDTTRWRVKELSDTDGNKLTFTYKSGTNLVQRETTQDGGYLEYHWDANNRIDSVITGQGASAVLTKTTYGYDTSGRLNLVTVDLTPDNAADSSTYWTQYGYDTSGRITSVVQKDGSSMTIHYDTSGRADSFTQTVASGVTRVTSIAYNTGYTLITDPANQVTRLDYDTSKRLTKITAPPAYTGATAQVVQFGYNSADDVTSVIDPAGNTTSYTFDGHGNVLTATDRLLNTVTRTYNVKNELTTEARYGTDAANSSALHTTQFIYDTEHHLAYRIGAEGTVTYYQYETTGELKLVVDYPEDSYSGPTYTFAALETWRTTNGDASAKVTKNSYDSRGNLATIQTYALASASGLDPASATSTATLSYDRWGQLLSRTVQGQNTESFVYDGLGRVVSSVDLDAATTSIVFNDASTQTVVTLANGLVQTSTYNKAGDLVGTTTSSDTYTAQGAVNYSYDADGRVRTQSVLYDATSGLYTNHYFFYDKAGRKIADVAEMTDTSGTWGALTEYRYDANDRLLATIAYTTKLTGTALTAVQTPSSTAEMSTIRPTADAADIYTWHVYDKEGRVVKDMAGDGSVTAYEYDASGNLVKTTGYYNRLNSTQIAALKADPATVTALPTAHAKDIVVRSFYDREGRLLGTLDGLGYLSRIYYDKAGQKVREIAFATATSAGLRAAGTLDGLTSGLASASDRQTDYSYDGRGQLRYRIDALNQVTEFVYDAAGNVIQTIGYAGSIAATSDYTSDNIAALVTSSGLASSADTRRTSAVYDAAGHLAYAIDAENAVTGYLYDSFGNATRIVQYAAQRTTTTPPTLADMTSWNTSAIANSANRVTRNFYNDLDQLRYSVDALGFITRTDYDNKGRALTVTRWPTAMTASDSTTIANVAAAVSGTPVTTTRTYDNADRLARVYDGEGNHISYKYYANGTLEQAISMEGVSGVESRTRYTYDAAGQKLTATVAYGTALAATTSYAYDGFGNVLTVTDALGGVTTNSYDQLGRLLNRTDAAGTTTNEYDAFGNVTRTIDGRSGSTYFYYDRLDRLIATRDPLNYVVEVTYSAFGQVSSTTRRANATSAPVTSLPSVTASAKDATEFTYYDRLGHAVLAADAEKFGTATLYSVFGEVTQITRYYNVASNTPSTTVKPTYTAHAKDAVTKFDYDKLGRLTKTTDAETDTGTGTNFYHEDYQYDAFGNRTQVTNRLGGVTTYAFDKRGLMTTETISVSGIYTGTTATNATIVNKFTYDARGNRTQTIEAYGTADARTTNYVYDIRNRLIDRHGTSVAIGFGSATTVPTETYTYDLLGRLIQTVAADGGRTLARYDAAGRQTGRIVQINATQGAYSEFEYDANGNQTKARAYATLVTMPATATSAWPGVPSGDKRETVNSYDARNQLTDVATLGLLVGSWNGSAFTTSTTVTAHTDYDAFGNAVRTLDAAGGALFTYYDKLGRKVAQVDQELYLTTWTLDAGGNTLSERRFVNKATGVTTAGYTTPSTHADDRVTEFEYDRMGRRTLERRLSVAAWSLNTTSGALSSATGSSTITYQYNALGNVAKKTEATGEFTTYTYDNAGRLIVERRPAFTEYGSGSVTPVVRYYYNGRNDLTSMVQGRETAAADDRTAARAYDAAGRLTSATDAAGNVRSYLYDAAGRVIGEYYVRDTGSGGIKTEGISHSYDLAGNEVRQAVNTITSGSWSEISYTRSTYDAFGQVTQRGTNNDSTGTWQEQLTYDLRGQVIRTNAGDGIWRHFIYDAAGRQTMMIESEGMDLSAMSQTTALANAYVDTANATISVYDKRGQATKSIQTQRELSVGGTRQDIVIERAYNAFGETAWEKDALLNQTDYSYNTMGRRTQVQHPTVAVVSEAGTSSNLRPTERFYYDLSGRLIGSEDANSVAASANRVTTRQLLAGTGYGSSEALVVKEWHLDTGIASQDFNVFGDAVRKTDEISRVTQFGYDKLGRLTQLTHAGGLVETYSYDVLGQRVGHWNNIVGSSGREVTEYDAMGRITKQVAFGGDVTTTSYSWVGTLYGAGTLGAGQAAPGGWQTTTTYQNGKTLVEATDLFGHVTTRTDMGGQVFTFAYDRAGRMTSRSIVVGGVTYEGNVYGYLNTGLIGQVSFGADTSATEETFQQDKTTYTYDKNGNRLSETLVRNNGDWHEYGHYEYEEFYPYDQYWVVDGANYWVTTTTETDSTATYDALNRMSTWNAVATDYLPAASITYYYDANSNIRRSNSSFHTLDQNGAAYSTATTQDYWYRFDLMNRVVTAKGVQSGSTIVRGTLGADYSYDAAGQRKTVTTTIGSATHREDYGYDSDGHLLTVRIADNGTATPPATGALKASYTYDSQGRQTRQLDYLTDGDSSSTAAYDRQVTYNAKGQIDSETLNQRQGSDTLVTTTTYSFGTGTSYALGAALTVSSSTNKNGSWYSSSTTTNTYEWHDGAVIKNTSIANSVSGGGSSTYTTDYYYEAFGALFSVYMYTTYGSSITYVNDLDGQVFIRAKIGPAPHERWYRFAGKQMGYIGNNGTLDTDYQTSINRRTTTPGTGDFLNGATTATPYGDFDQSLAPVNSYSHGGGAGTYTAKGGETLAAIAAQAWGDSSLWYKLADANGLAAGSTLAAGQILTIPAGVMRSTHNASTFNPYDPAAAVGDTTPTAPIPQTPTRAAGKKGCGTFGVILMIAVAVAVAAVVGPAVIGHAAIAGTATGATGLTAAIGATGAAIVGGAIAGVASSLASQLVGLATGNIDRFSWKAVALAGIGGAVAGGLSTVSGLNGATGAMGALQDAGRAALGSAITQGIGVATGLQDKFDWAGVALAGVMAGVGRLASDNISGHADYADGKMVNPASHANQFAANAASSLAGAAARSLLTGTDFGDNVLASLPDLIGSTIGQIAADSITGRHRVTGEEREALLREARGDEAVAPQPEPQLESDDDLAEPFAVDDFESDQSLVLSKPGGGKKAGKGSQLPMVTVKTSEQSGNALWDFSTMPTTPADTPNIISFGANIAKRFQERWNDSVATGLKFEDGQSFMIDIAHPTQLWDLGIHGNWKAGGSMSLVEATGKVGYSIAIQMHTHPYPGGYTGIAFDGADVAALIDSRAGMSVVQSGKYQFLLVETRQTPKAYISPTAAAAMQTKSNNDVAALMQKGWSFSRAVNQVTINLAKTYNLAYYQGSNGSFRRVWPPVQAPAKPHAAPITPKPVGKYPGK